jgi:hypothetical protein
MSRGVNLNLYLILVEGSQSKEVPTYFCPSIFNLYEIRIREIIIGFYRLSN